MFCPPKFRRCRGLAGLPDETEAASDFPAAAFRWPGRRGEAAPRTGAAASSDADAQVWRRREETTSLLSRLYIQGRTRAAVCRCKATAGTAGVQTSLPGGVRAGPC